MSCSVSIMFLTGKLSVDLENYITWILVCTDTYCMVAYKDSRALRVVRANDSARLLVNITDLNITEYPVNPVFLYLTKLSNEILRCVYIYISVTSIGDPT